MISWESIGELFVQLELDLIRNFRRNLAKHEAWEKDEGFSWPAWQALKLRNMEEYRKENQKILGKAFPQIEADTMQLLQEQYAEGYGIAIEGRPEPRIDSDLPDGSFFGMNNKRLNRLIEDMTQGEKDVKTAALRMMDDVYRSTVAKAQLSMASGTKTLAQAVDMAAKDFLSKGINCIEFKDGRRMNIASYSEMALRTAATRAKLQGEAQRRKELGIDTVAISQYGQCSDTCLPWQGRVYVDDVFADFEGERNAAGSFMLSRDGHWYRPLSHAVKAGLFHPNCRHTMTTWQRGINPMPEPMDFGPIEKAYKLEQKQRRMEQEIRKWKRLAEGSQDPMNAAMYRKQEREAQKNLREFISNTNEAEGKEVLRRSPWREKTFSVPDVSLKSSAKSAILESIKPDYVEITAKSVQNVGQVQSELLGAERSRSLQNANKRLLVRAAKEELGHEVGVVYSMDMKQVGGYLTGAAGNVKIPRQNVDHIILHNHPDCGTFSFADLWRLADRDHLKMVVAVGNDGSVYLVEKTAGYAPRQFREKLREMEAKGEWKASPQAYESEMESFLQGGNTYGIHYSKVER